MTAGSLRPPAILTDNSNQDFRPLHAVLNSVAPAEMGKASGINYMMQRFGAVFAIAIASSLFSTYGHLSTASGITDGFKPALAASAAFSLLATAAALLTAPRHERAPELEPAETTIAA